MKVKKRIQHLLIISMVASLASACQIAEIRTLEEDAIVKEGFRADQYVRDKWDTEIVPTYVDNALDLAPLLSDIEANPALITELGQQESQGDDWNFMVQSDAKIIVFGNSELFPEMQIDLPPYDGEPDVLLALGPPISASLGFQLRDAPGTISFGEFVNQNEHGEVAKELLKQAQIEIATAFGVDDPRMIKDFVPADYEGLTISFVGAMKLVTNQDMARENWLEITVVPVKIEVLE